MRKIILAAAGAAALLGTPALAQDATTAGATDTTMTAMPVEDDDRGDFPWGLLGLLGLAGLLGRNKRDTHVHNDTTVRRDV